MVGGECQRHGRASRESAERRSRTTYRPTVTPEGSTHVESSTGPTSSITCTVARRLAPGPGGPPAVFAAGTTNAGPPTRGGPASRVSGGGG
ncbi:hypothetical protein ACFPM0_27080 [Pseudonocardia sulfidoxydans]|uniref:hypothetical protein n=1 Tax=Pseudonocardia sulfidoxydans TaxID=54011 RepID=UPI0036240B76